MLRYGSRSFNFPVLKMHFWYATVHAKIRFNTNFNLRTNKGKRGLLSLFLVKPNF
jgi:hypothetical protein